jgi:hypothetical protein
VGNPSHLCRVERFGDASAEGVALGRLLDLEAWSKFAIRVDDIVKFEIQFSGPAAVEDLQTKPDTCHPS